MRNIAKFTKQDFERFTTESLILHPFHPRTTFIANKHVRKIRKALEDISVDVLHRGSTLFQIAGKGDIDIGIYTTGKTYNKAIELVSNTYFPPQIVGKDFVAFYIEEEGFKVEISLMQGREAVIDKAITLYLAQNKKLQREYEIIKKRYFYSKREYFIQRAKFFNRIIKEIPD
jgi:hypothetical protein